MARTMIRMVYTINKENFGGKRMVTCYSCHHGGPEPKTIPSLTEQYSEPQDDPNDVEIVNPASAGTAEKILDKGSSSGLVQAHLRRQGQNS
jgi:hypothetical protein